MERSPTDSLAAFARKFGIAVAVLAALPVLVGWLTRPPGTTYLPYHMSLDDHMVYAAWMRQAVEGSFFFDNRFASLETQPGLTVHLYFFALGLIAKALGITLTLTLARVVLSYVFVVVLARFIALLGLEERTSKLALFLSAFGGGVSWIAWQTFGDKIESGPAWYSELLHGMQPIDNWQPEGFVFPSMLTNGLFLAAGCLILITLSSIIKCRESWKPVLPGAIAFFTLMNIHSYDVLLVAMVLVAYLVSCAFNKTVTKEWLLRSGVICSAAIPPAMWFVYVLKNDSVFQSRAATPTFSPDPIQIAVALLLLVILGLLGLSASNRAFPMAKWGITAIVPMLFIGSVFPDFGTDPLLSPSLWVLGYGLFGAIACLLSPKENRSLCILVSWACVSLIAPYFPALFQRKLTMLIVVPWAILAAIGIVAVTQNIRKPIGSLVQALCAILCCLSSVLWLKRDLLLGATGVSRTLVHSLYLNQDETKIIEILNKDGYGKRVLAMPGVMNPTLGSPPIFNDMNAAVSGLTGAYTFAGHWSETPDYNERRNIATEFFIKDWSLKQRADFLKTTKTDYLIAPSPQFIDKVGLAQTNLTDFGDVLFSGDDLWLIRIEK